MAECKRCPKCGNLDYDDDFTIMTCSECGNSYMTYLADDGLLCLDCGKEGHDYCDLVLESSP